MEANFNLGSLKIVQKHLSDYLKKSIENISGNISLITVEKKHPTDFSSIEYLGKTQRTLEMIGLNGLGCVLSLVESALNKVKNVEYDTKNSLEILGKCQILVENSSAYLNRLVTSGVDQPTVFFDLYSSLANKIGIGSNIKDLFFPKLEFSEDIPTNIKQEFKNSIVINETIKDELLSKIESSYIKIQELIPTLVEVFDNFGSFNSESSELKYSTKISELKLEFKKLQDLKVNKAYFSLFGIYQLYLSIINPIENSSYKKFVADNSDNIKSDLIQTERTVARLINNVSSMEIGEKTSSLLIEDSSIKDLVFNLCYFIHTMPSVKNLEDFKHLAVYFDLEYYVAQLFDVIGVESILNSTSINDIVNHFNEARDLFNLLSQDNVNTNEFLVHNSKFIVEFKKISTLTVKLGSFHKLISSILATSESVQAESELFNEGLKTEISLGLVAIDFAINNYIKNELFENLSKDFTKEAELISTRISAAMNNDLVGLSKLSMPQLDNLSLKAQEEQTFSQLFTQIQVEIDQVEEVLDYFLRNEGENIDEINSIQKPLTNLRGVFAIVGEYELINIINNVIDSWKNVYETKLYDVQKLQHSISLLSGLSLLVKAYSKGNLIEAEELQRGLLKIFYKEHSEYVPTTNLDSNITATIANSVAKGAMSENTAKPIIEEVAHENNEELDFDLSLELPSFTKLKVKEEVIKDSATPELSLVKNNETHILEENSQTNIALSEVYSSFEETTNDPDIAEVFFMEADEVLESLHNDLRLLRENLTDNNSLVDIRRKFHTLKGSGRMVGLEFMGEAAWMVEQTLNKCISNELVLSEEIVDFCDKVALDFGDWVNQLKTLNKVKVPLVEIKKHALSVNPNITNHVEIVIPEEVKTSDVSTFEEVSVEIDSNESVVNQDVSVDVSFVDLPTELESVTEETIETTDTPEQFVEIDLNFSEEEGDEVNNESGKDSVEVVETDVININDLVIEQHSGIESAVPELDEEIVDVVVENIEPISTDVYIDGVKVSGTLYDLFMEESSEHIKALKEFANSNFEDGVQVTENDMRHAHTLSSIAASVNMSLVSELASKLEDVLLFCLDKEVELSQSNMSPIRHAVENLDLLRTADSSSYISYCDGMIENLVTLHEELQESIKKQNAKDSQQPSQIDIELLSKSIMSSISVMIEENHKNIIDTLERKNQSLSAEVKELVEKVSSIESEFSQFKKRAEISETSLNRALEVAKNDIRVMANIVKKKSERIEALSSKEAADIQEIDDSEVDSLAEQVEITDQELNLSLDQLASESKSDKSANVLDVLFEKYPQIKIIFEDKVASAIDEIEDELYELAKLESEELLEKVNFLVEGIDQNGLSNENNKELKRYLHTIKGGSRMAGANKLGILMHRLESLMDFVESRSLNTFEVKPILISEINKASFLLKNGKAKLSREQKKWLDGISGEDVSEDEDRGTTNVVTTTKDISQFIRVPTEIVDSAITDAGEIRLTRTSLENINNNNKRSVGDLKSSSDKLLKMVKEVEIQAESQIKARKDLLDSTSSEFDPLEFDRFTRLQELTRFMNETVLDIHESIVGLESTAKVQDAAVSQQSIVSNNLLSELMKVRLVPFETTVDRFYKIARNTAKEVDKKVSLQIFGEKTELDKVILDKIISPLEHLLRNSIAHGIENQEERLVSGKTPIGEISIDIVQEGNSTIIKLVDDGAGINLDKVRSIGVARGLIKEEDSLSKEDIINLIFQSGFSTAETVSQISGRGVGMDVVKSEITSIGGTVKVTTEKGQGTTFILTIPMSIATNQCVLSFVRDKLVAVPAILVENVGSLKESQAKLAYENRKITLSGKEYDFMYAGHLLGLVDVNILPDFKTYNSYMIIKYVDEYLVVHVDKIATTSEVLIKTLGSQYAKIDGVLGATVLGDGKQGLVVNPVMVKKYFKTVISKIVEVNVDTNEKQKGISRTTVMVVDDSITVRRATTKVLERNNFHVITAKDGEDALEQLQISTPDIILSDIEMPRMDGFEFVKNVRNVAKYHNIPIVMITSRTADKHKNFAFELGANDFLGKPYKEEDLVEKINILLEKFKEIK